MTIGAQLRTAFKFGPAFAAGWAIGQGRWSEALFLGVLGLVSCVVLAVYEALVVEP